MNTSDKELILFLHIQKTAGMTLQEKLRSQYGPHFTRRLINRLTGKSYDTLPIREAIKRKSTTDDLFMGHFCFGIHRHINRKFTYITFLREPVSRLISLYNYSANNTTAYYHSKARGRTIDDFLLNENLLELDNGMTRFLAGNFEDDFINRTPYGNCNQELLELAIRNVENYFSFVGIQELFDNSMLMLARTLRWENPYYLSLNIAKTKKKNIELSIIDKLREQNQYDIELYSILRKRFELNFNKLFGDDNRLIERYKIENTRYQKYRLPVLKTRMLISRSIKKIRKSYK